MKILFYFFIILLITGCANNKVYWCGDHPCINKKEKEAYFKKNMIIEVRKINKKDKNYGEIEKITQQAIISEKQRIKDEKELAKQKRIAERNKIKEEKKLAKKMHIEEKKRIKEEKKLAKKNKNLKNKDDKKLVINTNNITLDVSEFKKLVEKIIKQNKSKPYPDIYKIEN